MTTARRDRYSDIERWSPPLVRMTVVCLVLFLVALVGLVVDHRVITGAPAWLKPVKFAASGAFYLFTLAWMVRALPDTRMLRIASRLIAWILVTEIALIGVQAARGTTSHFNVNTPLNTAIFSTMGIGIAIVWVMSMVMLWLYTRAPTIGGTDGGPGLPLTRWSREHGDLRVPHFLGMHALQLLPLLLLGIRRLRTRRDDATERGVILFASAACAAVFFAALLQALQGHPLVQLSMR